MSESDELAAADVIVESEEDSQEAFQPVLRRRGRPHLGPTQASEPVLIHPDDLLNPQDEPERLNLDPEVIDEQNAEQIVVQVAMPNEDPPDAVLPAADPLPPPIEEERHEDLPHQDANVISLDTPSPPKKRKRLSKAGKKLERTPVVKADEDDEDDGMQCPICLDSWEMSGDHRLVALKCGHLFGESCIKRWLTESMRQSAEKVCPQCKKKAKNGDLRPLYARRLRAIDRTEEHRMRQLLDEERLRSHNLTTELATVKMSYTMATTKLQSMEQDNARLRELVRLGGRGAFDDNLSNSNKISLSQLPTYRLYMEKNFEITRDPGCRVMLYSTHHSSLMVSQKSAQNLFPGYGVRFIDPPSYTPLHFLHTSALMVRDICISSDQHSLVVASREPRVKLFDVRSRQCSAMFTGNDKALWACSMDRNEREHFLYLGDLNGNIIAHDVRFPDSVLNVFQANANFSPVIQIAAVPAGKLYPNGGFLVCQLTSLTFYEYCNETAMPTTLNVEGPFLSMQYDPVLDTLLISARSNTKFPTSRFILAQLNKIDGIPVLDVKAIIFGSKATPIMTKPSQVGVGSNTLVVGYLQDNKQLMMYDVRREERLQTLPVNEVVYDICPVTTSSGSYIAALTDKKCRIYKVTSS